jgi:hypothetical protein
MEQSGVVLVDDKAAAIKLARDLQDVGRTFPAVVVTIPASQSDPYIDAERIADELTDLASVHVMPTRDVSWSFAAQMPARTQVYGGAGRVYPVGLEWIRNPYLSPLRFAFSPEEGEASTAKLVNDGLKMASDAGLVGSRAQPGLIPASGVVRGIIGDTGRALVLLDSGQIATVHEELTFPGVPLDRLLSPGMRVMGAYDQRSHRLDIRPMAKSAADCLAHYAPGSIVLSEVASVGDSRATLLLHPRTPVEITREQVTSNPADRLTELMSTGEVIPARVVRAGEAWSLSLADVDDDEAILPAATLFPDGPAWLEETPPAEVLEPASVENGFPTLVASGVGATLDDTVSEGSATTSLGAPSAVDTPANGVRPTPLLLDRARRQAAVDASAHEAREPGSDLEGEVRRLVEELADVRAESTELRHRVNGLRTELTALREERDLVTSRLYDVQRQLRAANTTIQRHRTELRRTKQRQARATDPREMDTYFLDREQQFRFEVEVAWARRIPPADKDRYPLRSYALGDEFLTSVDSVHGVDRRKVIDVVVEVVTGLAVELHGRELHQLRQSEAGDSPTVVREDGATCWRAAIQSKSPAARRLHYWQLRDGETELSRVVVHDDMEP